jgi:predicted hexulose-6-phosphate isomerase
MKMEPPGLGVYEKGMPGSLSLEEKLAHAARSGFDYMELSIDETDEKLARLLWGTREIRALREAQDSAGIPIISLCLSGHRKYPLGHPDPSIQRESLRIMHGAILLAARLGLRLIQIAGYDVYYEPSTERTGEIFGENLARSVEMAAREGVVLAFETMETGFLNTVGKALSWVDRIQSPYLQIYPDLGNITNAALTHGTDVLADLAAGRGHLAALHLKESKPGTFREVPYGQGHVRFPEAVAVALKLGVRLFVGEFWYTGQEDWRDIMRGNEVFLRGALHRGQAIAEGGLRDARTGRSR